MDGLRRFAVSLTVILVSAWGVAATASGAYESSWNRLCQISATAETLTAYCSQNPECFAIFGDMKRPCERHKTFRAGITWVRQSMGPNGFSCSLISSSLAISGQQESHPSAGECTAEKIQRLIRANPHIWSFDRLPPATGLMGSIRTGLLHLFAKVSMTGDYALIAQRRRIVFSRQNGISEAFSGALKTWDYTDAEWLAFGDQFDLYDPTFKAYGL